MVSVIGTGGQYRGSTLSKEYYLVTIHLPATNTLSLSLRLMGHWQLPVERSSAATPTWDLSGLEQRVGQTDLRSMTNTKLKD